MPESTIYKHSDYMQQSGIDLEFIMTTMHTLTALQQITSTLKKEFMRTQFSQNSLKSQTQNLSDQLDTSKQQKSHLINNQEEKNSFSHFSPSKQHSKMHKSPHMNRLEKAHSQIQMNHHQHLNQEIEIQSFSQKYIPFPDEAKHQDSVQQMNFILSPKNLLQTETLEQTYLKVDYLIEEIHHQFVDYYNEVISLTYIFVKWKLLDICGKFTANSRTWEKLLQKKPYLNNTKNLFLKAHFLEDYLINVKIYFNEIIESYPITNYYLTNPNDELSFLQIQVSSLRTEIELDYSQKNKISASRAVRQLRNLVQITTIKPIGSPFLLGFWVATVILIILGIFFILQFFDINFTTNTHFERTFPIWRGLWYFIYLIWLMGINTYIFNYYKINFNLLTAFNNYHLPNPSRFIICAAIFTSIHFLLFLFYLIKLAEIGNNVLNSISQDLMAGISWVLFLGFFIVPLRYFYFRQRLYPLMMFFRSVVSPIIGVEFKFSIFMELFVSFRQPIRDMIYTFTYYFVDDKIVYWDTIMYETITGIVLYFFRIVQNCRMMYQNRLCGGMPIYSIAKSFLGFITMIASYLSKNQTSHNYYYLYIWLLTALASTSLAYYMDLWNDWGFLDPNHAYLRKTLIYRNKKFYYAIIVLNLILRFVWMLNVSPDVLRRIPVKPYIVVMIVSSIQITRRGIWIIFRVQKQHISSQNALNKLFVIQDHIESELKSHLLSPQQKQAQQKQLSPQTQIHPLPQHQKQLVIKSPNWLQLKLNPKDHQKKSNLKQFLQQNNKKIMNIKAKIQQADKILRRYSSQQEKFLAE